MEADVLQGLTESLEVDNLSLTEKLQRFDDVRIICQVDQTFIGAAGFCSAAISS